MTSLPAHWRYESLAEIAAGGLFRDGDWVESKDQDPSGAVRLTQLADVGVGGFRNRSNRWMRRDQAAALGCTFLVAGDILIARMPDPLGRACLLPDSVDVAVTAVDVAILRVTRRDIDSRYVMWALNGPTAHRQMVSLESGTTRKRISRKNLERIRIPVPPIEEQRRIVEILEDHLSRVDAARQGLNAVTRRLRALVASQIESTKRDAASRASPIRLADLAVDARYGTSTKCVVGGPGAAVVRIPNLVAGSVDLADEKRVLDASLDVTSVMLQADDLLVVRTNGSRDLIGRTAVVPPGITAAFASYLIRYRLDTSIVRPAWAHLMMQTPSTRSVLESMAASSAGQYNLGLTKLDEIRIPVPPLAEQDRLLEASRSVVEGATVITKAVAHATERGVSLRRAVMSAAFSGQVTSAAVRSEEFADV